MIAYIKPYGGITYGNKFESMEPISVTFNGFDDRVNETKFICSTRCSLLEIQIIYGTAFDFDTWTPVDISFADDMRIVTHGRFCLKILDPKNHVVVGEIEFNDMAEAVEICERESLKRTIDHPRHDQSTINLRTISEPVIKEVLSNGPATIIFWNDGTKTIVKREIDDEDDLYDAVANALAKKAFGSTSKFHKIVNERYRTNHR